MTSPPDYYCIKWNDYHNHLGNFFANLFSSEQFTDVTLCAEKTSFKCHKAVLSAGSPYLEELLRSTPAEQPIIILAGVKAEDIKIIIDFIYHGEMKNVDYERFVSVLQTAELLKINGLTEVTIFHSSEEVHTERSGENKEHIVVVDENIYSYAEETVTDIRSASECSSSSKENISNKKQKSKNLKKYREGNLDRALKDMEWGMPLTEASRLYKIPRSTLYSKAKLHSGLQIVSRKEHSNQDCHPALQAIADGMSLKRAAEEFNIPKTVLWRRVQKRLDILSKVKCRKKRGGKQQTESEENQKEEINSNPKYNSIQSKNKADSESKRTSQDESKKSLKRARLSQAVAACKMGKMSQAAASTTFQVPKTTIWRRLQKCSSHEEIKPKIVIEKEDHQYSLPDGYQLSLDNCIETNLTRPQSPDLVNNSVIILNSSNCSEVSISNPEISVEIQSDEIS